MAAMEAMRLTRILAVAEEGVEVMVQLKLLAVGVTGAGLVERVVEAEHLTARLIAVPAVMGLTATFASPLTFE